MAYKEPVFYKSSGQWRLDLEAWKRNQDFQITSVLHSMSLDRLQLYLQDMAEAEAERYVRFPFSQKSPCLDRVAAHDKLTSTTFHQQRC